MKRFILLCFALMLSVTPAFAATTYYVATTGNDSNNGTTVGTPFRSIQKCVNTVVAGDTCTVADGTYQYADGGGIASTGIVAWFNGNNGTAGSPITIKSTNYLGAVIAVSTSNNGLNVGFYISKAYYIVQGFDISGGGNNGANASTAGIGVYGGGTGVLVRRNTIHGMARTVCTNGGFGNAGIYLEFNTGVTIDRNVLYGIGRLRNGESGCSTDHEQHDHGMYVKGTTNTIITNNIVYDTNRGWPLHIYGGTTTNIKIWNNLLADKSVTGAPLGQVMLASTITTASIKDNIFSNPQTAPFTTFSLTATSISIQYNLTDSTDADLFAVALPSGVTQSNNITNTSPGFVNAGIRDYTLASGSAAVDAGTSVCTASNGSACDIGPYETFVFASCVVENGDASTFRVTFTNNQNPPLTPTASPGTFTARKAGAGDAVTASTVTGTNRVDLTVTTAIINGNAIDVSWSTGSLSDSALIGGNLNQGYKTVLTNQSCTNNVGAAANYTFTQAKFEWHGLRGTENSPQLMPYDCATCAANGTLENYANSFGYFPINKGGSARLRFAITNATSDPPPTGFVAYVSRNAGGYIALPSTFGSDHVAYCGTSPDPDIPNDFTATTGQLSTAGFVAGALLRSPNGVPSVDMGLNGGTEMEICVTFESTVATNDTFAFRMRRDDGTALDTYTVTPTVQIRDGQSGSGF